jgi:shikimate dehydrogenase
MQNAGLAALGLNWRYLAFDVYPLHLREAIEGAKMMGFIGVNLTVPHKLLAVDMVDTLDDSAHRWGAVNTVRFEARDEHGAWQPLVHFPDKVPGQLRSHGFNTDADGIARSLHEDLDLRLEGAKVLLLGAGGAGQVAAMKLAAERVAELHLVNRTANRAETLAKRLREDFPQVKVTVGYPQADVDLVLNATSLGLRATDPLPLDETQFALTRTRTVYDMVYRPATTALLGAAKAAGCRVANGIGMLLHQGARALEIWTGQPAPLWVMREALEKNLYGGSDHGR